MMKFKLLISAILISGFCYSQKYTYAEGVAMGKRFCRPDGAEIALQQVKHWRGKGQTDYADGIMASIEACVTTGKFKSNKKSKVNPVCTSFAKKYFSGLYKAVGCEAIDKKKKGEK